MNADGSRRHPDEGRILAYLDGELSGRRARRVRRHLDRCASCRRRRDELDDAAGTLDDALDALDVPPPERDAASVRARGRSPSPVGRAAVWKAAALVLAAATAAGAVVPGSPVREWIADSAERVTSAFVDRGSPSAASEPAPSRSGGVAIPAQGRVEVAVTDPAAGLRIRVRTVDDTLVSVAGVGGRYRLEDRRIGVDGPEGPELRLDVPPSAAVRVSVDGEMLLEQAEDGRLTVFAPVADTADDGISVPVGPVDE